MRILFFGDVLGRSGRTALVKQIPILREKLRFDFLIVNAENATNGLGLSAQHANELLEAGVDVITLGDHAFDQRDMLAEVDKNKQILRPVNLSSSCPGAGARIYQTAGGKKIMVIQALGQVFMKQAYDNPFAALDAVLNKTRLGGEVQAIVVDFHAEATSEKVAMGHFLDGRASLVVGTHTHVPTSDARILSQGTGYLTDAGMSGDYDSVIGMKKEEPLRRFVSGIAKGRFQTADGKATLCGVLIETDDSTGLCKSIRQVKSGGILETLDND